MPGGCCLEDRGGYAKSEVKSALYFNKFCYDGTSPVMLVLYVNILSFVFLFS